MRSKMDDMNTIIRTIKGLRIIFLLLALAAPLSADRIPPPRFFSVEDLSYSLKKMPGPAADWKPLSKLDASDLASQSHLWVAIPMPDERWPETALYISAFLNGFEIYAGSSEIYQYGAAQPAKPAQDGFQYNMSHLIPLTRLQSGNPLRIRIHYFHPEAIGTFFTIGIGSRSDLLLTLIEDQRTQFTERIHELFLGALLLLIGCASLFVFLNRYRMREYGFLSFGFFALTAGAKYMATIPVLSIFNVSPYFMLYAEHLLFWLAPVGFFALIGNIFGPGPWKILSRLWRFHLLLTLCACFFITWHPQALYRLVLIILIIECSICLGLVQRKKIKIQQNIRLPFTAFILLFIVLTGNEFLTVLNVVPGSFDLFGWGILGLVLALGFVFIAHYNRTARQMRSIFLELEKNKTRMLALRQAHLRAQYEALKNQLNPHFLFNNLSTLILVIENDPREAIVFVQKLSDIYRYVLQTRNEELIALKTEIDFVKSYTFLLSKRFGANFSIEMNLSKSGATAAMPPLSLQLLIENAVKHNIISSSMPLRVEILSEDGYIVVRNNLQPKTATAPSTGIGLENIRQRYQYVTKRPVLVSSARNYFQVKIPVLSLKKENV